MNIIVKPHGNDLCYCRPDTTWERESKDFYCPDCISEIYWTPITFARASKAGKCIKQKFAARYFDAIGFGALLYCGKVSAGNIAFLSCADHTSLLPFPMYNPLVAENKDNLYEVIKDGTPIWKSHAEGNADVEDAICRASELTSIRIGDIIAVELAPAELLACRTDEVVNLKAKFCENTLFDMKLIF